MTAVLLGTWERAVLAGVALFVLLTVWAVLADRRDRKNR